MLLALIAASAIAVCAPPPARRWHCVVDGDTLWWHGEKIRIAEIDAPELTGRCAAERRRARAARDRLVALLDGHKLVIRRTGTDRFGRTLAQITSSGTSIGEQLLREGHATRWPGRKDWCL